MDFKKRFNQFCFQFILVTFSCGLKNRRKLTELQTEKRTICYQKRVQWGLSLWIIRGFRQIRYLVSYLPPSKNISTSRLSHPPLHSINWSSFQRVFLKAWFADCQVFQFFDILKRGARGEFFLTSFLSGAYNLGTITVRACLGRRSDAERGVSIFRAYAPEYPANREALAALKGRSNTRAFLLPDKTKTLRRLL